MTTRNFDRPEGRPDARTEKLVNKGLLIFREQTPYDPCKDEATRIITHRGGVGDARTEHY